MSHVTKHQATKTAIYCDDTEPLKFVFHLLIVILVIGTLTMMI